MPTNRAVADDLPKVAGRRIAARASLVSALCLLPITHVGCGGNSTASARHNPLDAQAAYTHVKAMVDIGPRPAGSKKLLLCRDYIVKQLAKQGIEARVDAFEDKKNAPSVEKFFNIEAEIEGTRKNDKRILVIGSHYDTKLASGHDDPANNFPFVGANDGASSSGLLLELARHYRKNPPDVRLLLVWFDGEESISFNWNHDAGDHLIGSKRCVQQLRKRFPEPLSDSVPVMVLLDMVGAKELAITHESQYSDPGLIDIFREAATRTGHLDKFFQYKTDVTDDHVPFSNLSINTIDLTQFDGGGPRSPWWHKKDDTMDIISAESLGIVGHVVIEALPHVISEFYPMVK